MQPTVSLHSQINKEINSMSKLKPHSKCVPIKSINSTLPLKNSPKIINPQKNAILKHTPFILNKSFSVSTITLKRSRLNLVSFSNIINSKNKRSSGKTSIL